MYYCKNCGEPYMTDEAVMCIKCGVAKGQGNNYCHNCGKPLAPDAAVCLNCGVANKQAPAPDAKSKLVAGLLGIFLGTFGVHNFYLGYTGMGILKLLTAGCFGILYIIDIVNIATGNLRPADGSPYEDDKKSAAQQPTTVPANAADELKKYKELLDQGVLTEEEFQEKKEQLLKAL